MITERYFEGEVESFRHIICKQRPYVVRWPPCNSDTKEVVTESSKEFRERKEQIILSATNMQNSVYSYHQ